MDDAIEDLVERLASGKLDASAFAERLDEIIKQRASKPLKGAKPPKGLDVGERSDTAKAQQRAEHLYRKLKAL